MEDILRKIEQGKTYALRQLFRNVEDGMQGEKPEAGLRRKEGMKLN